MPAHQVPCGLFMRRGAFTLKCDVSGGLTLGRAQEITLKETIWGPSIGATPPEKTPRKRLIVAAARQNDQAIQYSWLHLHNY